MSTWDRELPPPDRSEAQQWPPRKRVDLSARGHIPFPNARGLLERLQAICRENYAVGRKEFAYPGIVEDIAAEKAELVGAGRVPGEDDE